jgi:sarcosine oxidase subunit beta
MAVIEADLAVVGCGAVGASCAYQAAKRGLTVAVFDAKMPTAGSSGACNGSICGTTKRPGLMMELTVASKALFPETVAELGGGLEYKVNGGLMICEDETVADAAGHHAAELRNVGTEITYLAGKELRRAEPALSRELHGAYHAPDEATINAQMWTFALVRGAVAQGARTFWNTPPLGFDLNGTRIQAMDTAAGRVVAEHYLFSAGVWSRPLGAMIGVDIPVVPRRGELVMTDRGGAFTGMKLISAKYLTVKQDADAVKASDDPVIRLGYGFSLGTSAHGQTMMGSTRAFVGYDSRSTPEGIATLISEAIKRVPLLAGARVLRCFAGFRPYVADGKPIVGRSGIVENLLVAAGHEGDGICLSPITGAMIADLAMGREPAFDITELTPDRFGVVKEGAEVA